MCNRAARRSGETRAESPTKVPLSLARDASSGQATRSGTFPATSWRIRPCPCVRLDTGYTHTHPHTHTRYPGAQSSQDCASVCAPGAQTCSIGAPGSTNEPYSCSREHNPTVFVLPGAHSSDTCAPGSTIQQRLYGDVCAEGRSLCSREHQYCRFVLPEHRRTHNPAMTVLPGTLCVCVCVPA